MENYYDKLTVNGVDYSGRNMPEGKIPEGEAINRNLLLKGETAPLLEENIGKHMKTPRDSSKTGL